MIRRIVSTSVPQSGRRGFRHLLAVATLLAFVSGIGHVWLHEAHAGDDGHFGAAIEKVCPSEKLVGVAGGSGGPPVPPFECERDPGCSDQWHDIAFDVSTAPRGPPFS